MLPLNTGFHAPFPFKLIDVGGNGAQALVLAAKGEILVASTKPNADDDIYIVRIKP